MTRAVNVASTTLPSWTTANRPASPQLGQEGLNTTLNVVEIYNGTAWVASTTFSYAVDYLIVAGGGGGGGGSDNGNDGGGGAGAGGMLFSGFVVTPSTGYSFVVGGGGTGGGSQANGTNGSNSTGFGLTAVGGGYGAFANTAPNGGGSGGGGGGGGSSSFPGGTPTANQGNTGGTKTGNYPFDGCGGGGRGSKGKDSRNCFGGTCDGGDGCAWVDGNYYAGGGGGGSGVTSGASASNSGSGAGGNGGGGHGGQDTTYGGITARNAQNGTANTGGGGGGGKSQTSAGGTKNGGSGGSGIVILRYLGSQRGSGGTVTSSGGYTYHTFTSSGTYTA